MRPAVPRLLVVVVGAVALLGALAGPAAAHARLVSTAPAGGATVTEPLDEVLLTFSEPVEPGFATVQVFDPAGDRLDQGSAEVRREVVVQPIAPPTREGAHHVAFWVVSADGHPVEATFTFEYEGPTADAQGSPDPEGSPDPQGSPDQQDPGAEPAPGATGPGSDGSPDEAPGGSPGDPQDDPMGAPGAPGADPPRIERAGPLVTVGMGVARVLNTLALAVVLGLLLAGTFLVAAPERAPFVRRAAVAAALWALSGLLLLVFGTANATARGVVDVLDFTTLQRFAGTRFGAAVTLQVGIAAGVAAVARFAGARPRRAQVALALAVAGGALPAVWGHARTSGMAALTIPAHWVHAVAAGAWLGGLLVLAWSATDLRDLGAAARRFSRLATWCILAVAVTGTIALLAHTDAPRQLLETTWGRLGLAKTVLLAGIALIALRVRGRILPRLDAPASSAAPAAPDAPAASDASADAPAPPAAPDVPAAPDAPAPAARVSTFRRLAAGELALMVLAFGLAGAMSSGIPAGAEAAARIVSVVGALGDGQVNLTVDPGRPGENTAHLYLFDAQGRLAPVIRAGVTFTGMVPATGRIGQIEARLVRSGPGHFVIPGVVLDAGDYTVEVLAVTDEGLVTLTRTITIG